jgi:hypothetical protein
MGRFTMKLKKLNLLKPTGYGMHQPVEYFNNCTLCVLYLYENKQQLVHLHKKLIGFYNWDEKCLQYGMDWTFKRSSLHSVF